MFGGMQDERYPGSKKLRRESRPARVARLSEERRVQRDSEGWDAHPLSRHITLKNGQEYEGDFFFIGALAKALGRRPNTIRSWITKGWLPKAMFVTSSVIGSRGNAGRRLWTRRQIENIARIAEEEGLIGKWHPDVRSTNFVTRVFAAYKDWA
jgi:hypothetical protein